MLGAESDDDDAEAANRHKEKEDLFKKQLHGISAGFNEQMMTLKKTITYAWIVLMRRCDASRAKVDRTSRKNPPPLASAVSSRGLGTG
jgi:cleavage stimulation factor subunit 3